MFRRIILFKEVYIMSILITGGAGYIGSHTCVELLNAGYEIVIADNYSNSCPKVLDRIKEISSKDFKFYQVDITDKTALERVFDENKIDSVIHFAGLKAVGESVAIPIKYYKNNINSTLVLCEVMQKFNVKKLVFSSSATVYGMHNSPPFMEDMSTSATNPYGRTKLMIEEILKDLCVADNTFKVALLRYFNPIGAHESGKIGENPNGIPNNLMPYITQVAVGKREKLSVYGDDYNTPDGTGVRDYIHVVDLAKGHLKALEKLESTQGVNIYNLGTGVGYSVLDIVRSFEKASNVNIPYVITARRPGDIDSSFANASKANTELGWFAEKTLEDMCRDSWNWQKNNPEGY